MSPRKRLCVLEQSGTIHDAFTREKKETFTTPVSDFRRLNWRHTDDPDADLIAPGVLWSEGRSLLYETVRDQYDYYLFMDDDIVFAHPNLGLAAAIVDLLDEFHPISATFYSERLWGKNRITPEMNATRKAYPFLCMDLQLTLYSRELASQVFPVPFHGSDKCMWYAFWLANRLNPGKQVCFSDITISNTRSVPHGNQRIRSKSQSLVRLFNRLTADRSFNWKGSYCKKQNLALFDVPVDSSDVGIDRKKLQSVVNWDSPYLRWRRPQRGLFHRCIIEPQYWMFRW